MKVLSIDIGVKNLAHCLIYTDPLAIMDWEVIDLTDNRTCSCLEKATHELFDTFYCTQHKSHTDRNLTQCIGLCSQHNLPLGTLDEMQQCLKKNTKKLSAPTLVDLGSQIIAKYNRQFLEVPDIVVIENQIGPLASKMKAVQALVIQYWLMRGVKVECVSACNKLKDFHAGKTTYAERKKLSVHYAHLLVTKYSLQTHYFLKHKKKDDLADTLLQGVWYINNCGLLRINCS